jgi:hypothetical protein
VLHVLVTSSKEVATQARPSDEPKVHSPASTKVVITWFSDCLD